MIQSYQQALTQVVTPHYSTVESDPVMFYGGPFSNFVGGPFAMSVEPPWDSDLILNQVFPTVEHFYQAMKTTNIEDFVRIAEERDTWEAKKIGNRVALRPDWDERNGIVKYEVMLRGLRVKFAEPLFCDALMDTGERYIAEDSPTDAVWGLWDPAIQEYRGRNLLGLALMQVRAEFAGELEAFHERLPELCPSLTDCFMVSESITRGRTLS